ncbi:hypothetical protein N7495_006112 [Penicillium taxi]|uniref:uncharacterized protein n=1 Tax=Penicillium taxi TaxID=168475 RepID=UPI0025459134|nr:uncharacterized protein N7495_006112 [Penicillium taxi]KAJ5894421.1 hypothetical protein N7495_006112 [Penicillium taxi]
MSSFFKKPEWAVKKDTTEPQFYRRSKQTYSDIVAADRQAQSKQKITAESSENISPKEVRDHKRPRISDELEEKDTKSPVTSLPEDEFGEEIEEENESVTVGPPADRSKCHGAIIDEEALPPTTHSTNHLNETSTSRPDQSHLCSSLACHIPQPLQKIPRNSESSSIRPGIFDQPIKSTTPHLKIPQPAKINDPVLDDPVVQILITSVIPNTKPLLIQRKMSQALREVRWAWCKRQGLTLEEQSRIYLTWKGRRLFDVTTCRGLGIKSERKISHSIIDDDLGTSPTELRIHIEAVTDDPTLRDQAISSTHMESQPKAPSSPPDGQDYQTKSMRLILRSLGLTDLRIRARSKTRVSKIITTFRQKKNIPLVQEVSILFDGDRLDPNMRLCDYDIDDEDLLDIQIKLQT